MNKFYHQSQFAGSHWDPSQYHKFSDYRLRPALDLLDRLPVDSPNIVYDLGCGGGAITRIIASQWESATVYGVDNSSEMLDKARQEPSEIQWIQDDVQKWAPTGEAADLIFSNATLQWVIGHEDLFPNLLGHLNKGGCLAVQMPLSWGLPSHQLMRETLDNGGPNQSSIGSAELRQAVGRKWVEDTEFYYDLLAPCSEFLDVWETEYLHVLEGEDPVLEWVKGTGLRPILNGLEDEERATFIKEYGRRLRETYPIRENGKTLYPFRRLFIVAVV